MTPIDAAQSYLAILTDPKGDAHDRIRNLALCLDQLSLAYTAAQDCDNKADDLACPPRPPKRTSYERMREMAMVAYPQFGFYPCVFLEVDPIAEITMGDAVDDIADIALDMEEFIWRCNHTNPNDAIWHFRFGYETHWGWHLHQLRSCVYVRSAGFRLAA